MANLAKSALSGLIAVMAALQVTRGSAPDALCLCASLALMGFILYLDSRQPSGSASEIAELKSKLNSLTLAVGVKRLERKV